MLKSILAATLVTSLLASGAMAATPMAKSPTIAKPATVLVHKAAMKKMTKHVVKHKMAAPKAK